LIQRTGCCGQQRSRAAAKKLSTQRLSNASLRFIEEMHASRKRQALIDAAQCHQRDV
jgi:hypothetical protein